MVIKYIPLRNSFEESLQASMKYCTMADIIFMAYVTLGTDQKIDNSHFINTEKSHFLPKRRYEFLKLSYSSLLPAILSAIFFFIGPSPPIL